MLKKLFVFLMLFTGSVLFGNNINTGLTFFSHTVNQDVRTSLNLTPDKDFNFSQGFSVEFDLKLDSVFLAYGYVFRIISNDVSSLDFVTNINAKNLIFVFMREEQPIHTLNFQNCVNIQKDKWMKVKVVFNKENISCSIDSCLQEIPYSFENMKKTKIYFGKNTHPIFYTTDVSPMTIRKLVIRDHRGEVIRNWEMQRHNKNEVYDEIKNSKALVENGIWEIDKHLKWKKLQSIVITEQNAQIAYDSIQARIFVATRDSLITYNAADNTIFKTKTKAGAPFRYGGSQMLYDEKNNRLISYSIQHPGLVLYDFDEEKWSNEFTEDLPPIQHHNRIIDKESNLLIVFGGYGNHQYKAILACHDLENGQWQSKDFSADIAPRYLSAMGYLGDGELLVIGGYGNSSGKQENLPRNLHDIHKINFKKQKADFLGELSLVENVIAFSNSMIIEKNEQKLYALTYDNLKYNSSISLVSVDWNNLEMDTLGDTIPYRFLDTESFCDLFLCKKTSTIYTIILHRKEYSEQYIVDVYSLAYPPISTADGLQTQISNTNIFYYFAIILFLLLLVLVLCYYRKKKNKQKEKEPEQIVLFPDSVKPAEHQKKKSAILLFGGFQVFDKDGNDITDSFTPILKQIFLFLLLNSVKGKKVTSEKLDEVFWLGMDKLSASNNRSVNIRKLRIILEKVGEIVISNKNSYWSVSFGDNVVCDYKEIMLQLESLKDDKIISNKAIEYVLELASGGVLLPNLNAEWADNYKSEYTDLITDVLMKATAMPEIENDSKLLLHITNMILLHDSIDEDAMRMKCRVLFRMGQKSASKQCFDKFLAEYARILNAVPNLKYEDILL